MVAYAAQRPPASQRTGSTASMQPLRTIKINNTKKMKKVFAFCLLFMVGVSNAQTLKVGDVLPDIEGLTPSGEKIKLSDLSGKIVLVEFWANWCKPCREEYPFLTAAYTKYKNEKFTTGNGFDIFSISMDTDAETWKKAILENNLNWKYHVKEKNELGKSWESENVLKFNVRATGIPMNFLINGKREILAIKLRREELQEILNRLQNNNIQTAENRITSTVKDGENVEINEFYELENIHGAKYRKLMYSKDPKNNFIKYLKIYNKEHNADFYEGSYTNPKCNGMYSCSTDIHLFLLSGEKRIYTVKEGTQGPYIYDLKNLENHYFKDLNDALDYINIVHNTQSTSREKILEKIIKNTFKKGIKDPYLWMYIGKFYPNVATEEVYVSRMSWMSYINYIKQPNSTLKEDVIKMYINETKHSVSLLCNLCKEVPNLCPRVESIALEKVRTDVFEAQEFIDCFPNSENIEIAKSQNKIYLAKMEKYNQEQAIKAEQRRREREWANNSPSSSSDNSSSSTCVKELKELTMEDVGAVTFMFSGREYRPSGGHLYGFKCQNNSKKGYFIYLTYDTTRESWYDDNWEKGWYFYDNSNPFKSYKEGPFKSLEEVKKETCDCN